MWIVFSKIKKIHFCYLLILVLIKNESGEKKCTNNNLFFFIFNVKKEENNKNSIFCIDYLYYIHEAIDLNYLDQLEI